MEYSGSGLPATFNSSTLNENQNEQNYYGVVTYQKSAGDLNFQVSAFGRNSSVHFTPDPIGDLFFNGVASDVNRNLYSGGLQADASYALGDKHTIRGGVMLLDEYVSADTTTTVFHVDGCRQSRPARRFPSTDNASASRLVRRGVFAGRMENPAGSHHQLRRALRRI